MVIHFHIFYVGYENLGNSKVGILCEGLSQTHKIRILNLCKYSIIYCKYIVGNNIGNEGASYIKEVLLKNPYIEQLNISKINKGTSYLGENYDIREDGVRE